MIFLTECSRIALAGITVRNSPAWNIHPVLSDHVDALRLRIEGPKNLHNTDGMDPESCSFVRILGCEFSVGDDCIAIKSGKLTIDKALRPAIHDVLVAHCLMHDGHEAVVLGSEAAGGIKDLTVRDCDFRKIDRGLRVKTRRGRGKDAVNEGILFTNIRMEHVLTPFVVNAFYFCDRDGKTDYVQSRDPLSVDERTPGFGPLEFRDIAATNCAAAAGYITGLPERKISELVFSDVRISFDPDAEPSVPAMASGVEPMVRQGITAQNVERLVFHDVDIEGQEGDELQLDNGYRRRRDRLRLRHHRAARVLVPVRGAGALCLPLCDGWPFLHADPYARCLHRRHGRRHHRLHHLGRAAARLEVVHDRSARCGLLLCLLLRVLQVPYGEAHHDRCTGRFCRGCRRHHDPRSPTSLKTWMASTTS